MYIMYISVLRLLIHFKPPGWASYGSTTAQSPYQKNNMGIYPIPLNRRCCRHNLVHVPTVPFQIKPCDQQVLTQGNFSALPAIQHIIIHVLPPSTVYFQCFISQPRQLHANKFCMRIIEKILFASLYTHLVIFLSTPAKKLARLLFNKDTSHLKYQSKNLNACTVKKVNLCH